MDAASGLLANPGFAAPGTALKALPTQTLVSNIVAPINNASITFTPIISTPGPVTPLPASNPAAMAIPALTNTETEKLTTSYSTTTHIDIELKNSNSMPRDSATAQPKLEAGNRVNLSDNQTQIAIKTGGSLEKFSLIKKVTDQSANSIKVCAQNTLNIVKKSHIQDKTAIFVKKAISETKAMFSSGKDVLAGSASNIFDSLTTAGKTLLNKRHNTVKNIKAFFKNQLSICTQAAFKVKDLFAVLKMSIIGEANQVLTVSRIFDTVPDPATTTSDTKKNPIPPTIEEINKNTANYLFGNAISRITIKPIDPDKFAILGSKQILKSATNYIKSGLSPPGTVSRISTILSAFISRFFLSDITAIETLKAINLLHYILFSLILFFSLYPIPCLETTKGIFADINDLFTMRGQQNLFFHALMLNFSAFYYINKIIIFEYAGNVSLYIAGVRGMRPAYSKIFHRCRNF